MSPLFLVAVRCYLKAYIAWWCLYIQFRTIAEEFSADG